MSILHSSECHYRFSLIIVIKNATIVFSLYKKNNLIITHKYVLYERRYAIPSTQYNGRNSMTHDVFLKFVYRNFYISLTVNYKNNLYWTILLHRFVSVIKRLSLAVFAIGIRYI